MAIRFYGGVLLVQMRLQQEERGNAAHYVRELPGFVFRDVAPAEQLPLPNESHGQQHHVQVERQK